MSSTPWSAAPLERAVFPEFAGGGLPSADASPADPAARAHQIVREAEREAQTLVEAARQRAAIVAQEGYREGRLQGRAEALAEGRGRLQQAAGGLEAAAARLHTLEAEFRARVSETIVSLALAVAERICRAEIAHDPAVILRAVQEAVGLLPEPGDVVVRVHPEQLAMLQEHRAGGPGTGGIATGLRFLSDPTVDPGDCLVETPDCLVDATLATQLEAARQRLRSIPE